MPIEVKYGDIKDMTGIVKFMGLFNVKEGLIISKNEEREQKIDNKKILVVPAWKWLLK